MAESRVVLFIDQHHWIDDLFDKVSQVSLDFEGEYFWESRFVSVLTVVYVEFVSSESKFCR